MSSFVLVVIFNIGTYLPIKPKLGVGMLRVQPSPQLDVVMSTALDTNK